MAGDRAGALAHLDDSDLLSRIAAGENPARIAESLGVHKSAIYHRFEGNKDYERARFDGMGIRVEESEEEIAGAQDSFTLARAREKFRAVAWRAEREFPHRWGQKQQIDHHITLDLGAKLRQAEIAIEGQCTIDASASDYVKLEDK